jgi:hypothetical protein
MFQSHDNLRAEIYLSEITLVTTDPINIVLLEDGRTMETYSSEITKLTVVTLCRRKAPHLHLIHATLKLAKFLIS